MTVISIAMLLRPCLQQIDHALMLHALAVPTNGLTCTQCQSLLYVLVSLDRHPEQIGLPTKLLCCKFFSQHRYPMSMVSFVVFNIVYTSE